jgi:hypothetical protein
MGLLEKVTRTKDETVEKVKEEATPSLPILPMQNGFLAEESKVNTSEGKPIYE